MPRPEVGSISREFLTQTRSIKASVTDQRNSFDHSRGDSREARATIKFSMGELIPG